MSAAEAFEWSAEDQARLEGRQEIVRCDGRLVRLPPHVTTPSGFFFIGAVQVRQPYTATCPLCGAARARKHPRADVWKLICFGCGRPS